MSTEKTTNLYREIPIPPAADVDDTGVWMDCGAGDMERIATTPAWVSALTCDADGLNWAVTVDYLDPLGERRALVVAYGRLLDPGPTLLVELADQGLLVCPRHAAEFCTYLIEGAALTCVPRLRRVEDRT